MTRSKTLLLVGCVLLGCAGATRLPVATQADADRAGIQLAQLESGRGLYLSRCSACHRPIEPARFAPDAWTEHVLEMQERTHLSDEETRTILAYLQTMSEAPVPTN